MLLSAGFDSLGSGVETVDTPYHSDVWCRGRSESEAIVGRREHLQPKKRVADCPLAANEYTVGTAMYHARAILGGYGVKSREATLSTRYQKKIDRLSRWQSNPFSRGSTIGEGGDTTISSPGRSPKQPLLGIGLHDPLHGW